MNIMETTPKTAIVSTPSRYDVNSGYIFTELQYSFKTFSREFLIEQVWEAYKKLVATVPLISISASYEDDHSAYIKNLQFRYKRDVANLTELKDFPFPQYYLFYSGDDPVAVGLFEERYVVKRNDAYFDLFFVLKILQTDIMELEPFLHFQLDNSFQDRPEFISFLKAICSKYSELLEDRHTPILTDFTESLSEKNEFQVDAENSKSDYTLNRQILFMDYLLKKAGVERTVVDLTEIARIVQGLISRQLKAKGIENTDIYKRMKNPLKDNSKGSGKSDLIFVRNLFEKLSLNDVVTEINKEINHLD
jgi:hypothetical protein